LGDRPTAEAKMSDEFLFKSAIVAIFLALGICSDRIVAMLRRRAAPPVTRPDQNRSEDRMEDRR
jgi:hypothetical protein